MKRMNVYILIVFIFLSCSENYLIADNSSTSSDTSNLITLKMLPDQTLLLLNNHGDTIDSTEKYKLPFYMQ